MVLLRSMKLRFRLDPQKSRIYQKLGQVLANQKDFQSAVKILKKAIDMGERRLLHPITYWGYL